MSLRLRDAGLGVLTLALALSSMLVPTRAGHAAPPPASQTFDYTGTPQTYVVPDVVECVKVDAYGASGGEGANPDGPRAPGGRGGHAIATIEVAPGESLGIFVGGRGATPQGGYNGGGRGGDGSDADPEDGGGGGGASDVRRSPYGSLDRLVVAGGGGGGGGDADLGGGEGGGGGGFTGGSGAAGTYPGFQTTPAGEGGTQTAGGSAPTAFDPTSTPGILSEGGRGGRGHDDDAGGGGGGGYYGGGGGAGDTEETDNGGGGGGGSGFGPDATFETGVRSGNGLVVITPTECSIRITSLELNDIDNATLKFLSADAHEYFGGNTRIHGKIAIAGDKTDDLESLVLEVLQDGDVVATAQAVAAEFQKLQTSYRKDGSASLTQSRLLFELPSAQADLVDGTNDGAVELRAKVTTASGRSAEYHWGGVTLLVHYTHDGRFGDRDGGVGGDDWVQPSAKELFEHYADLSINSVTIGDISNMNGGKFSPHQTHRCGLTADAHFIGYNARDANTADVLIGYLNDPLHGTTIQRIVVTFTKAFRHAIEGVQLSDGRSVEDVIRNASGHTTHFHWELNQTCR